MNSTNKKNYQFPKWSIYVVGVLVLTGFALLGYAFYEKNNEAEDLKEELREYSLENEGLKDSIGSLALLYEGKISDLNLLTDRYQREKDFWEETTEALETKIAEMSSNIDTLMQEKRDLIAERDKFQGLLNKGLDELSQGQIDILKKQVREKERQLLAKDKQLFEYREARDFLSDKLVEANKKFLNNEAFVKEMTVALVDFYNFLRVMERNTFSLKEEVQKITKSDPWSSNDNGYIEGTKIALDVPSNELYGGSPFLREMEVRMKDHKKEVEALRAKHGKLKQLIDNYDSSLVSSELVENLETIIKTIEIQEKEILDYEIALRTRYLLIASTDELKEMGIVLRNDWRRDRPKRKIDLGKIDLSKFSIIDYEHDTTIKIPDSLKFRSIVTAHKDWSSIIDRKENMIYIRDKAKFWEISSILIIETE